MKWVALWLLFYTGTVSCGLFDLLPSLPSLRLPDQVKFFDSVNLNLFNRGQRKQGAIDKGEKTNRQSEAPEKSEEIEEANNRNNYRLLGGFKNHRSKGRIPFDVPNKNQEEDFDSILAWLATRRMGENGQADLIISGADAPDNVKEFGISNTNNGENEANVLRESRSVSNHVNTNYTVSVHAEKLGDLDDGSKTIGFRRSQSIGNNVEGKNSKGLNINELLRDLNDGHDIFNNDADKTVNNTVEQILTVSEDIQPIIFRLGNNRLRSLAKFPKTIIKGQVLDKSSNGKKPVLKEKDIEVTELAKTSPQEVGNMRIVRKDIMDHVMDYLINIADKNVTGIRNKLRNYYHTNSLHRELAQMMKPHGLNLNQIKIMNKFQQKPPIKKGVSNRLQNDYFRRFNPEILKKLLERFHNDDDVDDNILNYFKVTRKRMQDTNKPPKVKSKKPKLSKVNKTGIVNRQKWNIPRRNKIVKSKNEFKQRLNNPSLKETQQQPESGKILNLLKVLKIKDGRIRYKKDKTVNGDDKTRKANNGDTETGWVEIRNWRDLMEPEVMKYQLRPNISNTLVQNKPGVNNKPKLIITIVKNEASEIGKKNIGTEVIQNSEENEIRNSENKDITSSNQRFQNNNDFLERKADFGNDINMNTYMNKKEAADQKSKIPQSEDNIEENIEDRYEVHNKDKKNISNNAVHDAANGGRINITNHSKDSKTIYNYAAHNAGDGGRVNVTNQNEDQNNMYNYVSDVGNEGKVVVTNHNENKNNIYNYAAENNTRDEGKEKSNNIAEENGILKPNVEKNKESNKKSILKPKSDSIKNRTATTANKKTKIVTENKNNAGEVVKEPETYDKEDVEHADKDNSKSKVKVVKETHEKEPKDAISESMNNKENQRETNIKDATIGRNKAMIENNIETKQALIKNNKETNVKSKKELSESENNKEYKNNTNIIQDAAVEKIKETKGKTPAENENKNEEIIQDNEGININTAIGEDNINTNIIFPELKYENAVDEKNKAENDKNRNVPPCDNKKGLYSFKHISLQFKFDAFN